MDALFKKLTISKGYIFGFASMFLIPRTTFDRIAIAYYDVMEPEYGVLEKTQQSDAETETNVSTTQSATPTQKA